MSLYIASLNSGSNGNCYYVGNEKEAILVDAGISCRETEKRMKRLGLLMERVKAVVVSHEHSDHIRGIHSLVKKFRLPVYITTPTLQNGRLFLDKQYIKTFSGYNPFVIGDLVITAFPKLHDACDPYSFTISNGSVKVGVFTDIGYPCEHLIRHFSECNAAFLEANYDEEMLDKGNYPWHLKKRIRGGKGHLSNKQALDLFMKYRPPFMSHLLLSHLSQNNNCPQLVQDLFDSHCGNVKMVVAPRFEETPLFKILPPGGTKFSEKNVQPILSQLEFSFA